MIQKGSTRARFLIGLAAFAVIASACSSTGSSAAPSAAASAAAPSAAASVAAPSAAESAAASAAPSAAAGGPYTVGISNPGAVGNGWREAMICSAKAQAVQEGNITSVTALSEKTDAAGQLAQIRDLITKGVNILLINPADKDSLNPAIKEAIDAGIAVVAIDAPVSAPGAYNLSNDQENYAYLGAKWLFEQLNGKGAVVYMRGIPGHPADTDRDTGFKKAMAEFPGITIAKETSTNWDQRPRPTRSTRSCPLAPSSTASGRPASTTSSPRSHRFATASISSMSRDAPPRSIEARSIRSGICS